MLFFFFQVNSTLSILLFFKTKIIYFLISHKITALKLQLQAEMDLETMKNNNICFFFFQKNIQIDTFLFAKKILILLSSALFSVKVIKRKISLKMNNHTEHCYNASNFALYSNYTGTISTKSNAKKYIKMNFFFISLSADENYDFFFFVVAVFRSKVHIEYLNESRISKFVPSFFILLTLYSRLILQFIRIF